MRWVVVALVVLLVGIGGWKSRPDGGSLDGDLIYHTAERTDLTVTITERGNLESQVELQVQCEVDDIDGDGVSGTPIIFIVPNGSSVKEGDLIVELDANPFQERLDQQELQVEEEKAEFIQAEVVYENQKTQNLTSLAEAQLQVELADLALKQFGDEEAGTFQLDLQAIDLEIQEARAGQLIEQTNLRGVDQLHKLGYRSSGELAEAQLRSLKADRMLAQANSRRRELVEYEKKKQTKQLEGALASAKRALDQVALDNKALLAQAEARLASAREQLAKEEELLRRYQDQLTKCKIYAPQDGMIAYYTGSSRWRREDIREGATVRPRQTILTLPNLERMQVKTSVHESVLDLMETGLPATVRVDAFPDSQYTGSVKTVAVLPDQGGWMSSDTKVYETVVSIDQEVKQLKPGMTAVVEIHAAHLEDVVAIPVQAIEQVETTNWIYVEQGGRPVRRCVTLGLTNNKFVEIKEGLEPGERVVLNPSAIPENLRPARGVEVEESEESTEETAADTELS